MPKLFTPLFLSLALATLTLTGCLDSNKNQSKKLDISKYAQCSEENLCSDDNPCIMVKGKALCISEKDACALQCNQAECIFMDSVPMEVGCK